MAGFNNDAIVPSSGQTIADKAGFVTPTWQRFFNALVSAPAAISAVTPTGSPFSFTAGQSGMLVITGGTVSGVTLTRNTSTITVPTGAIAMANRDVAEITYAVAPTINFVPR